MLDDTEALLHLPQSARVNPPSSERRPRTRPDTRCLWISWTSPPDLLVPRTCDCNGLIFSKPKCSRCAERNILVQYANEGCCESVL